MYTITWMILKNIMLSKRSKTQKCTYCVIPFTLIQTSKMNIVKKFRNVVPSEREGLIGKEHELILGGAECFLYCLHRCMHVGKQTELYSQLCTSLCKYVCYLLKRTVKKLNTHQQISISLYYGLAILKLLFVFSRLEQMSAYIKNNERQFSHRRSTDF